jgi:hypothetical protein
MDQEPRAKSPHPITLGCIGVGTFLATIYVFILAVTSFATKAGNYWPGFVVCALAVLALFAVRRRRGPAPQLSAVAVGAAAALVVVGTCLAIVSSNR